MLSSEKLCDHSTFKLSNYGDNKVGLVFGLGLG